MADRLEMEAGFRVDPSGLNQMETMAKQAGVRIGGALSGTSAGYSMAGGSMVGAGGRGGVIGESVVLMRELGRGNYSRIPGSISILVQRMGVLKYMVKDTALESEKYAIALERQAAKAEALAVIKGQEAAASRPTIAALKSMTTEQLGQNFALQGAAVDADRYSKQLRNEATAAQELAAAEREVAGPQAFLLSAWGWVIIALVALAAALYIVIRHYNALAAEQKNLRDLINGTRNSIEDEAKSFENAIKEEQSFTNFLRQENSERKTQLNLMEEKLTAMKEEAAAQREIMSLRGASAQQLLAFDRQQLEMERALLQASKDEAESKMDALQYGANDALDAKIEAELPIKNRQKDVDDAAALAEAVKKQMEKTRFPTVDKSNIDGWDFKHLRPADKNDIVGSGGFKVGGEAYPNMSFAKAQQILQKAEDALKAQSKSAFEAGQAFDDQKDAIKDNTEMHRKATAGLSEIDRKAGIEDKYGATIASLKNGNGGLGRASGADSLISVGNFLGSSRGQIETLAQEQVKLQRQANVHLGNIDRNTGGRGNMNGYSLH